MTSHDEERLRAGLRALSRPAHDEPEARAHTEQVLRAAFRQQHRRSAVAVRGWTAASLALAASLVVAMVRWPVPPVEPLVLQRPPITIAPVLQAPRPAIARPVHTAVRRRPRPVVPRPEVVVPSSRQRPASSEEFELATEFLPVTGAEFLPPPVRGQLVRVQVPRSTMRSFGLPVVEERSSERIRADLLLGEDGLARAVRFVK